MPSVKCAVWWRRPCRVDIDARGLSRAHQAYLGPDEFKRDLDAFGVLGGRAHPLNLACAIQEPAAGQRQRIVAEVGFVRKTSRARSASQVRWAQLRANLVS